MKGHIALFVICFIWSCKNHDNVGRTNHNAPAMIEKYSILPLEIDSSEGWFDVSLSVVEISEIKNECKLCYAIFVIIIYFMPIIIVCLLF